MSNEQLRNTLVGLLIISSVACLFYLSYVITTQEPVIASYRMDLNAEFDDVAGLMELNPIRVSGVLVGRVGKVSFDPKTRKARVVLSIINEELKIPKGSVASIATEGLLGQKYIQIKLSDQKDLLKDGDVLTDTESVKGPEEVIRDFVEDFSVMVKSSLGIQELYSDGSNRYYSIVLPESIESLTPGAKVYYKGMYVGSVTKVYLIEATQDDDGFPLDPPEKHVKVEFDINNMDVDITTCTQVDVRPELGQATLHITHKHGKSKSSCEQLDSGSFIKDSNKGLGLFDLLKMFKSAN